MKRSKSLPFFLSLVLWLIGSHSYSQSSKVLHLCETLPLLSSTQFERFLKAQTEQVQKNEEKEEKKKIKLTMLSDIEREIKLPANRESGFQFSARQNLFHVIIRDVFEGGALKALQVYLESTLQKSKESLFYLSGAGKEEGISDLKSVPGGYELTVDRVYQSEMAYNTKNKIQVKFYELSPSVVAVVNQHLVDYGNELKSKKEKKEGKPYGPILYDLTIDVYKKLDEKSFQFISHNVYEGQTQQTRFKSLNVVKGIGNILSLGSLDKGLSKLVEKNARTIWATRKEHFQKLILRYRES
ncbi:MAG: hypothetical protein HY390_01825 [Deltaproteobacteria bacterium]|nr:hypothetical protein [Deltaproteobacteria bacterium]